MAAAAMRTVPVVLMGCGPVGHAVVQRLATSAPYLQSAFGLDFRVVAVCDSSGTLLTKNTDHADQICQWRKAESKKIAAHSDYQAISKDDLLQLISSPSGIAVDCTATDDVTPFLKEALQAGGSIVMANKRPLTGPIADFKTMLSPQSRNRVGYESTVGAGSPFVAATRRVMAGGGTVTQINCTLSGTLGFLTSGLQEGRGLSELVNEAYVSGYTEPDPRDDLSGFDVARKALILSRTVGWERELSDIQVNGLYPPELQDVPVEEFLKSIASCDAEISQQNAAAKENNAVLRYVASIKPSGIEVGLKSVPLDSPIGRLGGTDNIMELSSDTYDVTPLVVQGAGAGAAITAAGVIADMVEVIH